MNIVVVHNFGSSLFFGKSKIQSSQLEPIKTGMGVPQMHMAMIQAPYQHRKASDHWIPSSDKLFKKEGENGEQGETQ